MTDAEIIVGLRGAIDGLIAERDALKHDIARHIQIAADLAQENEGLRKDADKWFLLLSDVVLTVPASFEGEEAMRHACCLNIAFKAIRDRAAIDAAMKDAK